MWVQQCTWTATGRKREGLQQNSQSLLLFLQFYSQQNRNVSTLNILDVARAEFKLITVMKLTPTTTITSWNEISFSSSISLFAFSIRSLYPKQYISLANQVSVMKFPKFQEIYFAVFSMNVLLKNQRRPLLFHMCFSVICWFQLLFVL